MEIVQLWLAQVADGRAGWLAECMRAVSVLRASDDQSRALLCVADDEPGLQQSLLRLRGIGGAATVAVCRLHQQAGVGLASGQGRDRAGPKQEAGRAQGGAQGGRTFRGADVVVDWDLTVAGAYYTGTGGGQSRHGRYSS